MPECSWEGIKDSRYAIKFITNKSRKHLKFILSGATQYQGSYYKLVGAIRETGCFKPEGEALVDINSSDINLSIQKIEDRVVVVAMLSGNIKDLVGSPQIILGNVPVDKTDNVSFADKVFDYLKYNEVSISSITFNNWDSNTILIKVKVFTEEQEKQESVVLKDNTLDIAAINTYDQAIRYIRHNILSAMLIDSFKEACDAQSIA